MNIYFQLIALSLVLGQDAFMLLDTVGERQLDKMLQRWHTLATIAGWRATA